MNASVGKRQNQNCIGKNAKGCANKNGEYLIEFCESNNLLLTNTCFPHKQSHLTTWQQTRINDKNQVKHIRKVIDYIIIEDQYRHIITNSRSYQGTEASSDHSLLITRTNVSWARVHQNKNKKRRKPEKFNTQLLVNNKEKQREYQEELQKNVGETESRNWKKVTEAMK